MSQGELSFENQLIKFLCTSFSNKSWELITANTTEKLWSNFRDVLNIINKEKLNRKLTDEEFHQARDFIKRLDNPYEAGRFMNGSGGKSLIPIKTNDGQDKFLTVFDKNNIKGNIYQVAKQVRRGKTNEENKDRRFDVTLLINGLPLIQIEEKDGGIDSKSAVRQMKKYVGEGQYGDIFSTLQILVAMTPHDVWYMANAKFDDFNEDFAFRWKNSSDDLLDYKQFCQSVLSPEMAYKMVTDFIILDNKDNNQSIKVMRYYQVKATQKIMDSLRKHDFNDTSTDNKKVGYIWHTTGSGKTISSFKTAFLASQLPSVKKVVFLVDRKALIRQTEKNYKAYDPSYDGTNNSSIVSGTDKVTSKKIFNMMNSKSNDHIIVATTQKFNAMVVDNDFSTDKETVFIVDEAHRSSNGEMIKSIKKAFKKSAWIGFTGTPDFDDENNITEDVFGPLLHTYTIKDAIADKNVLGFHVEYIKTFDDDDYLKNYIKFEHPEWNDNKVEVESNKLSLHDKDKKINGSVFVSNSKAMDSHIPQVVSDILSGWNRRSHNGDYNAILTTSNGKGSSKKTAIKYYYEFKKQLAENNTNLKVALTFSEDGTNGKEANSNNKDMLEILKDYNSEFGTNFNAQNINLYFNDLITRLNKTCADGKYLDLVIVVDQLLTGFDAPQLNTLYVDRILKDSSLIQAYSRTNRVYDMKTKPFGNIVNYRFPVLSKENMDEALSKYSMISEKALTSEKDSNVLSESYESLKESLANLVKKLSNLTDRFKCIPKSESERKEAQGYINKYNSLLTKIKQYGEYDEQIKYSADSFFHDIGITPEEQEKLTGSIYFDLKNSLIKEDKSFEIDIDPKMELIGEVNVNVDYLLRLLVDFVNSDDENEQIKNKILYTIQNNNISQLSETQLSNIKKFLMVEDSSSEKILNSKNILEFINNLVNNTYDIKVNDMLKSFIERFGLQSLNCINELKDVIKNHEVGKEDLFSDDKVDEIIHSAFNYYANESTDSKIRGLSRFQYADLFNNEMLKISNEIKKMGEK